MKVRLVDNYSGYHYLHFPRRVAKIYIYRGWMGVVFVKPSAVRKGGESWGRG